jgi:outer membrane protein OmpA-like peptidoglycan-associated protein
MLERQGVQVIRLGQTQTLIFPSDRLFENDTAEIQQNAKPVLNVVADFIQSYSTVSVEVAAYTNKAPHEIKTKFGTISDELTTRQADIILHYLSSHHVGARFMYAAGQGGRHAIAWDGSAAGRHLNRRVEISFRYYRDSTAWY